MPSRKQRRRRQKQQRHEWEEVYVDEEGREVPAEEAAELEPEPAARSARSSRADGRASRAKSQPERARRSIDPPSWRRTFKRGLLFFPLMLLTIFLIAGDEITTAQKVVQTLVLMAFFLPFSYFMDSVVWRSAQRRLAKQNEKKG
jgi:cation transport ATPase